MTGDLRRALDATLEALKLEPVDQAIAGLACALADEIDQAEVAERVAERALRMCSDEPDEDVELKDLIRALRTKCGHRDAIVRVGQRLEAVLRELMATRASSGRRAGATPFVGGALSVMRGGKAG